MYFNNQTQKLLNHELDHSPALNHLQWWLEIPWYLFQLSPYEFLQHSRSQTHLFFLRDLGIWDYWQQSLYLFPPTLWIFFFKRKFVITSMYYALFSDITLPRDEATRQSGHWITILTFFSPLNLHLILLNFPFLWDPPIIILFPYPVALVLSYESTEIEVILAQLMPRLSGRTRGYITLNFRVINIVTASGLSVQIV